MICIWSIWCHCHSYHLLLKKIQNGLPFFMPTYPGCPGKRLLNECSSNSIMVNIMWPHFDQSMEHICSSNSNQHRWGKLTSSPQSKSSICHQQGHAWSKTSLQQNPPVLNQAWRLVHDDLHNGCQMAVCVYIQHKHIYVHCVHHTNLRSPGRMLGHPDLTTESHASCTTGSTE